MCTLIKLLEFIVYTRLAVPNYKNIKLFVLFCNFIFMILYYINEVKKKIVIIIENDFSKYVFN